MDLLPVLLLAYFSLPICAIVAAEPGTSEKTDRIAVAVEALSRLQGIDLEANPSVGKISNESPVGRALLGHKTGDEVLVSSPIKTLYKIRKIIYKTA